MRVPPFPANLAAQFKPFKQALIARLLCVFQVVEELPAARDHLDEAAARVVVFQVLLQMAGEMVDAVGQAHDLHVGTACVLLMNLEGFRVCDCGFAHGSFCLLPPPWRRGFPVLERERKHGSELWQENFCGYSGLFCEPGIQPALQCVATKQNVYILTVGQIIRNADDFSVHDTALSIPMLPRFSPLWPPHC